MIGFLQDSQTNIDSIYTMRTYIKLRYQIHLIRCTQYELYGNTVIMNH